MQHILISISQQILSLLEHDLVIQTFSISSAARGTGTQEGSYKTPTGNFVIAEKHGFKAPIYTIFKSRKPQGTWQRCTTQGDLILTRILWLDGVDEHNENTKQRYIYLHGTNHENLIGTAKSCGCIRMLNSDVVTLYDKVGIGTKVRIEP